MVVPFYRCRKVFKQRVQPGKNVVELRVIKMVMVTLAAFVIKS